MKMILDFMLNTFVPQAGMSATLPLRNPYVCAIVCLTPEPGPQELGMWENNLRSAAAWLSTA